MADTYTKRTGRTVWHSQQPQRINVVSPVHLCEERWAYCTVLRVRYVAQRAAAASGAVVGVGVLVQLRRPPDMGPPPNAASDR